MIEGAGGEPGRSARTSWPTSPVITVIALVAVSLLLLVLLLGGQTVVPKDYDDQRFGSIADWFAALGAVLAVPLALWVAGRTRADEHRSFLAAESERQERRERERHLVREALHAEVRLVSVVEADDEGGEIDPELAVRWRSEMGARGWRHDTSTGRWSKDGVVCTTRELVSREETDLVKKPWTMLAVCRNHGGTTVHLKEFIVELSGGRRRPVDLAPSALTPHATARACVLSDEGLPVRYKTTASAGRAIRGATALVGDASGPDMRVEVNVIGAS